MKTETMTAKEKRVKAADRRRLEKACCAARPKEVRESVYTMRTNTSICQMCGCQMTRWFGKTMTDVFGWEFKVAVCSRCNAADGGAE